LLDYYSVWPFFLEIGLLLAIAATPLFRAADSPPIPTNRRIGTFDGLRGFLALSVFFHHTAVYHDYLCMGIWRSPSSRFYLLLGPAGVSMFFMITGYLFYAQLLKEKGLPDWKRLYIGRIFRIIPLYWFAVVLVVFGVMVHTAGHLNVSPIQFILEIVRWSMGALFPEAPIDASVFTYRITLYVTWTLRYEWFFYLSLLALAIPVRWRWSGRLFPPVFLCVALIHEAFAANSPTPWTCVALFLIGMSAAALRNWHPNLKLHRVAASLSAVALIVLAFLIPQYIFRPIPELLLGAAFLLIESGANLFGLLSTYPARRLGNISYGIYLLQGAVFAGASSFNFIRAFDLGSPLGHWTVSLLEAIALVVLATITHRFIERPGIDLGRRLVSRYSPIRELQAAGE
jgi:peptidoglycan/LPS O-acetylase OafA/YrhL